MTASARFGFRCSSRWGERRLVDAAAAFVAHCAADPKSEPGRECYLSAFAFPAEFKTHLDVTGSTAEYRGRCWSQRLWLDVDRDSPAVALADVKRLVGYTLFRYSEFSDDDLLYFFTGKKGYHVGVPLAHTPEPSAGFNAVCKALAGEISAQVGVGIDPGIYDKVRLLRAPNSAHPTTGRHKVRLTHDELMGLSAERIAELARTPIPFEPQAVAAVPALLVEDWQAAEAAVREKAGRVPHPAGTGGRLNRSTLDYIRQGAADGERHTRLFRAAANLREFNAPPDLITALLEEPALDSGLPPSEVTRQIRCGIAQADRQAEGGGG